MQHEPTGRIGLDHMCVRPVVPAEREAAFRGVGRFRGTDLSFTDFDVRRVAELPVLQNRQHRDRATSLEPIGLHRGRSIDSGHGSDAWHGIAEIQLVRGYADQKLQ